MGNLRVVTDLLRFEKKLYAVVFNGSKKYTFYVLPEFLVDPDATVKQIKDKHFPRKLPNVITSVTVVEGG